MITIADPIYHHDCPMCGSPISGICWAGSWSEFGGGGGSWMHAKCASCDIDFGLTLCNRVPAVWRIPAPPKTALKELINPEDRERLDVKLLRYEALGQKWRTFTSRCRPLDQLWRYTRKDGETAIAVVRNGTPIAEFSVFGSL